MGVCNGRGCNGGVHNMTKILPRDSLLTSKHQPRPCSWTPKKEGIPRKPWSDSLGSSSYNLFKKEAKFKILIYINLIKHRSFSIYLWLLMILTNQYIPVKFAYDDYWNMLRLNLDLITVWKLVAPSGKFSRKKEEFASLSFPD